MSFKSNKRVVLNQYDRNKAKTLQALSLQYTSNAMKEMDTSIYHAPVSESGYKRTGLLRASQTHQLDTGADEVVVGNSAHYASYVEMGTRHMPAKNFMQNALNNYGQEYEDIANEFMGEGFS